MYSYVWVMIFDIFKKTRPSSSVDSFNYTVINRGFKKIVSQNAIVVRFSWYFGFHSFAGRWPLISRYMTFTTIQINDTRKAKDYFVWQLQYERTHHVAKSPLDRRWPLWPTQRQRSRPHYISIWSIVWNTHGIINIKKVISLFITFNHIHVIWAPVFSY